MGIPFTVPMGFLFTITMGFLFTIALGIQLTISPRAGAWIETHPHRARAGGDASRPPRGGVEGTYADLGRPRSIDVELVIFFRFVVGEPDKLVLFDVVIQADASGAK